MGKSVSQVKLEMGSTEENPPLVVVEGLKGKKNQTPTELQGQVKRGRGRPKGSRNKAKEPEGKGVSVSQPVTKTETKRGRPKGSKNKPQHKEGRKTVVKDKPASKARGAGSSKVTSKAKTPKQPSKLRRTDPVYDMLWDHNRKAVDLVLKEFAEGTHALVVQPTGSGKTGVTFGTIEQLGARAHRVMIVQPYTTIEKGHKQSPFWRDAWDSQVRYMTYSRLSKLALEGEDRMREAGLLDLDLVVFDEVHHINAAVWSQGYHKLVEYNPKCLIMGLTATPIRYLDNNFDVAEEYFDGKMVETLTLHEAIRTGVFQAPVYISDYLDRSAVLEEYRNRVAYSRYPEGYKQQLAEAIDSVSREWATKLTHAEKIKTALEQYEQGTGNPKFIVFAPTVDKLKEYQPLVKSWFDSIGYKGGVRQYEVYSGHASKDAKIFEQFSHAHKTGVDLLFAVDKLNEGVHLEGVTGLIMLRGTASPIVFYQQLGRVFHAGMKHRPLVFDFVNNHDVIKDVKSALVDKEEKGSEAYLSGVASSSKSGLTGTEYSSVTIYSDLSDLSYLDAALIVPLLPQQSVWLTGTWDEQLSAFGAFVRKYKRLPHKRDQGGVFGWVMDQLQGYREGRLSESQRIALQTCGVEFN